MNFSLYDIFIMITSVSHCLRLFFAMNTNLKCQLKICLPSQLEIMHHAVCVSKDNTVVVLYSSKKQDDSPTTPLYNPQLCESAREHHLLPGRQGVCAL